MFIFKENQISSNKENQISSKNDFFSKSPSFRTHLRNPTKSIAFYSKFAIILC